MVPMLCVGLLLIGTGLPVVDTQGIVVPPGSLHGPTPFGTSSRSLLPALCNSKFGSCLLGHLAVGAYYFNWYDLEDQWKRYSQTRHPVLGHYDQSVGPHCISMLSYEKLPLCGRCSRHATVVYGLALTLCPSTSPVSLQDPSVISKHHEWGKKAGIDFFAMAWSGGGSDLIQWERADEIDRRITSHLRVHDGVKVALMYNIRDFVQAGSHGKIDLAGLSPAPDDLHLSSAFPSSLL